MMQGLLMKYFVLKPNGSNVYAKASRAAMFKYADVINDNNPKLAKDLRRWVNDEITETFNIDKEELKD